MNVPIIQFPLPTEKQKDDLKIINKFLATLNQQLEKDQPEEYQDGLRYYYNYYWKNGLGYHIYDSFLPSSWQFDPSFIDLCFFVSKTDPRAIKFDYKSLKELTIL